MDKTHFADAMIYTHGEKSEELPMKISEVRKGQQVEFYDSNYSGGPHLGEVVEIIEDKVAVNFTHENEVYRAHLHPGQLKLMKQAFTLQEEILKMITNAETRLHATIDKKISRVSDHVQELHYGKHNSMLCNQMTKQFQVLDKRMVEEIGKGIERIDYLNKHAESMEKELEAAQKNVEHYKQQFIASELANQGLRQDLADLDEERAKLGIEFYNFKNNSISNFKGYCLAVVAIVFAAAFFLK